MRKQFLFIIILFKLNPVLALDTLQFNFSLKEAISYSLENDLLLQNAVYDEQIARNKVKEITGIGLPQLNGSFDVKDFIELPTSLLPAEFFDGTAGDFIPVKFGTRYNTTASIDASQLLFDGNYILGLKATKVYLELARKNVSRTKIDKVVSITKAYYTVLLNEERLKLIDANVTRLKKLLDDTKVMYENGIIEKLDLDRIRILVNNISLEKDKVQRLLSLSYTLLKFQIGMDQSAKLSLTDKIQDVNLKENFVLKSDFDYSKRIEYSLLETQLNLARLGLKKNKFGYLPNVVLYGSLSTQAQRNEFNIFDTGKQWYPIGLLGFRIGIPIFDGLQKNYQIQQSKINILKVENDKKFLQQSINLEFSSSKISLENSIASLEAQHENVALAEEVYRIAKLKYEQGIGSNIEVLNAETSLKEAQTNYINALYEALISKVDFEKANGTLSVK